MKAQEIAESWINGNISWCKQQLYGKKALKFQVYEILQGDMPGKCNDDAKNFYRIILKGE